MSNSDGDFITETIRSVDGYLDGEREAEEQELREDAQYQEWQEELDEVNAQVWDEYLDTHCPIHNEPLRNKQCLVCEAEESEERRTDH